MSKKNSNPLLSIPNDLGEKTALVAEMYYVYKISQQEIADRLSLSRPWISKLLKRAEESGMVTIEVNTPSSGLRPLEQRVAEKFQLKNAKIVRTTDSFQTMADCAKATAHYLMSIIRPSDTIGMSWGHTLSAVSGQFLSIHLPEVVVIPLVGGVGMNSQILCNQVVTATASKLNAQYLLLHAPAFACGIKEKDAFMSDPNISSVLHKGENVDIAVLCAAGVKNSTLLKQGCVTPSELSQMEALGAVGDISTYFVDRDGNVLNHPIHERLISCDIRKTRNNSRETVFVAFGPHKVPVIYAALRGNWCDVLVTDSATADLLLSL